MTAFRVGLLALAALAARGDPTFLFPQNITLDGTILWIVAGDFNNDGIDDFAVSYQTGPLLASRVILFLGSRDGHFVGKNLQITPEGDDTVWAAADPNLDGNLDIVTGSGVALGNGDGTFGPLIPLGPSSGAALRPRGIALPYLPFPAGSLVQVADFNNDGIPDICFAVEGVRLGRGDGTFGPPILIAPLFSTYPYPNDELAVFTLGDFNGDGNVDIAYSGTLGGVGILFGNGDGTFRDVGSAPGAGLSPGSLIAGSLRGNGKVDLVQEGSWGLAIMLGRGDGTFPYPEPEVYPAPSLVSYGYNGPLAMADFDGDKKQDIASYFFIYPGNGDGTVRSAVGFGQTPGLTSYPSTSSNNLFLNGLPYGPPPLVVADVNGDGKPDLIGVGPTLDTLSILINSTGTPVASAPIYHGATGLQLLAPGVMAVIYGTGLSAATATATDLQQTTLGNTSVEVFDFAGRAILAPLLYVSPTQINFLVPDSTAVNGPAIVNVIGNGIPKGANSALVVPVAPGIFTLDGSGKGEPFASAVRVASDGTQTPVPTNQPIQIDNASQVYLSLYGTGFRQVAEAFPSAGSCTLASPAPNSTTAVVDMTYYGPQSLTSAIDQINIPLPGNTPKGQINITCGFYDITIGPNSYGIEPISPNSNAVTITVQ